MKISRNNVLFVLTIYSLILLVAIWYLIFSFKESDILEVNFLKVGQGDATLITNPNKTKILIDSGPTFTNLSKSLTNEIPIYNKKIDLVILSHGDLDHSGGLLSLIENFNVGMLVMASTTYLGDLHNQIIKTSLEKSVPIKYVTAGDQIILGDVVLDFLWPKEHSATSTNDTSIVFKLTYKENSFLFTGDISDSVEIEMVDLYKNFLDSNVLKVAHHGSKTSSNNLFLNFVTPEFSILSFEDGNKYGHPHNEVIERLKENDSIILQTNKKTQTIISNGEEIKEWY